MTSTSAQETATQIEPLVAAYVRDLQALPSSARLNGSSQATIYAMACNLLQAGHLQRASAYLSFLLLYAPTHPDYLCAKAHCAMQEGDPHQAADLLSLALYVSPKSCAIALALAEALMALQANQAARHILLLVRQLARLPADMTEHTRAELLLHKLSSEPAPHAAS